jgi:hypothetical protein
MLCRKMTLAFIRCGLQMLLQLQEASEKHKWAGSKNAASP